MDSRIDAIYGRQSIDKKDSISIESQFEFCRYELKGGEGKEYKDKGYSGKNIERPDFQRLLQDIRLGLIKRVIVYKLDRISRSIVDFAKLMELFKQYDVEFVSCTEKFDTSTPMGRAMLNICIVFAQLERESIQMRVQDAFYSRCTKGYYMWGRTPYGFDTEPIVMDGIKTKKLVENAEMDFAELMYQMYAEPGNSYGDISRYFAENDIKVYDKSLKRGFIAQLLRNPVYVQADMDIYEYFKAQGVKIESPPEMFTGDNSCYLYQGREGEEPILVIALLGLWNGKCEGYAQVRSGKVADCLYSRYDPEWYVTSDGEFMCADHHHDGTNYYWYRVWKKDVDEDQRDDLMDKIYCHSATSEEILALTNPIGPEIAKVYGWTITPLQATA